MNPATFVAGAIVGASTATAWALVVIHPPHPNDWWNLVLVVCAAGSIALGMGVLALLVDGVKRA